ncbi:MAG: ATP-binding cassette domain-containing protein, partial [Sinobacteraceae bacterium]|nr:ATP-binding cassette domain-containing protein [Nevskiaceae bacterium]
MQSALAALDAGNTRAQIAERTGIVVGVANANLRVERGEISVLMGLSGSGKSTLLRAANGITPATRG